MGTIRSGLFMSLDGVVESPDRWQGPYFDDAMGAAVGALMADNTALLLGRRTYDEFAAYWPNADPSDPFTAQMNDARKLVVSRSLDEATWANSSIVSGDVREAIVDLKRDERLGTTGSATLVRWMVEQGLVDELHLFVHPLVVGRGQRLFTDGAEVPLRLLAATPFPSGVVHLTYGPAAP